MPVRRHQASLTVAIAATAVAMPIVATFAVYSPRPPAQAGHSVPHRHGLPTTPASYAPVKVFTTATAVKPNVVVDFATTAAYDGGAARADEPVGRRRRCDSYRTVRQLPKYLRRRRPRLPPPGHPELRSRDERSLVLPGLQSCNYRCVPPEGRGIRHVHIMNDRLRMTVLRTSYIGPTDATHIGESWVQCHHSERTQRSAEYAVVITLLHTHRSPCGMQATAAERHHLQTFCFNRQSMTLAVPVKGRLV